MTRVYFLEIIVFPIVIVLILFHSIAAAFWVRHLWCWMKRKQLQLIQLADSDKHSVVKASVSYNLGTDITKTKFLIAISILEVVVLYYIISIPLLLDSVKDKLKFDNPKFLVITPNCSVDSHYATFYHYQWFYFLYTLWFILIILYILLLTFLCRYLSQRILNLSYNRALKQYGTWFLIQTVLLLACSTIYTVIISYVLVPALLFINWMLLVREGMRLSRVLKFQLLEIFLFEYKIEKYNRLDRAKKTFLIYIKTTIAVVFLIVTLVTIYQVAYLLRLIIYNICLIFVIYHANPSSVSSATYNTLKSLQFLPFPYKYLLTIIGIIMQLLFSIPYIYYTFLIILNIISKRLTKRQYRFNYENLQIPLIRKT